MPRVYLDSCIVIYLHEAEASIQAEIRDRLLPESAERPILHISDLTRLECRAHPLKLNDRVLLADYDQLAAAIVGGCDQFWTNDHRLAKVEVDIMLEVLP